MSWHESLVGRDNSDSFPSCYQRNILVADIPRPRRLRKEFDIRNIIHRINYFFEGDIDIFFLSIFFEIKILDKLILFEKIQNLYLEIGERHRFYGSSSCHICIFDSDKQIMDRSVNIRHLR